MSKKLVNIQSRLKAPKGQRNTFGNYNYRSCEDILEAVKPLLKEYDCSLTISDEVVLIGDRFYIKAIARLKDEESGEETVVSAYAREEESKKGMDGSQITGAASSYARKYALNGLFAIDDTKDSDATNTHGQSEKISREKQNELLLLVGQTNSDLKKMLEAYKVKSLAEMTEPMYEKCKKQLQGKQKKE